jgi:hypothetical protein
MFVHAYTDRFLHFGNRATSRVEGAHSLLKLYLKVSTGDLKMVLENIDLLLANMHKKHEAALAIDRDRISSRLQIPLFAEIVGKVTPKALLKILYQLELLDRPQGPGICYHSMSTSMGLPCHHQLQQILQSKGVVRLQDIHPHWYLNRDISGTSDGIGLGDRLVRDPLVVVRNRGRPKGSPNKRQPASSTRRDPSRFEREDMAQAERLVRRRHH